MEEYAYNSLKERLKIISNVTRLLKSADPEIKKDKKGIIIMQLMDCWYDIHSLYEKEYVDEDEYNTISSDITRYIDEVKEY